MIRLAVYAKAGHSEADGEHDKSRRFFRAWLDKRAPDRLQAGATETTIPGIFRLDHAVAQLSVGAATQLRVASPRVTPRPSSGYRGLG